MKKIIRVAVILLTVVTMATVLTGCQDKSGGAAKPKDHPAH